MIIDSCSLILFIHLFIHNSSMFYTYLINVFSLRMILKESKHDGVTNFNYKIVNFSIVNFVGYYLIMVI